MSQYVPVAAAAYLSRIKKARKRMTYGMLALALETSDSQVQRVFSGKQDSRGSLWFQVAKVLGASQIKLAALLADTSLSAADGVRAADWWLSLSPEEQKLYEALMQNQSGRGELLRAAAAMVDSLPE